MAVLLFLAVVLSGCHWPNFMFGPDRTGFNPFETTVGVNNVSSLQQLWSRSLTPASGAGFDWSPTVADGAVYLPFGTNQLGAFDPTTGAVKWTADLMTGSGETAPTVSDGLVYESLADGTIIALDATNGDALWQTTNIQSYDRSPVVSNGVLYASSAFTHALYAFDAHGVTNCSGTPKVCSPLWSAALAGGNFAGSPSVANGVVYVGSTTASGTSGQFSAFDANGVTNCSGTPKVCSPLWTAMDAGVEAVAYGKVYAGGAAGLFVFDAAGSTNCSGTPKTCAPLWTTPGNGEPLQSPSVANGVVYLGGQAFDAKGVADCSGTPATCSPLWTAPGTPTTYTTVFSPTAIANGVLYVVGFVATPVGNFMTLYAYDLPASG